MLTGSHWAVLLERGTNPTDVPAGVRAVRDGQIVTAMFPQDLPAFFRLIFEAAAELEG